MSLEVEFVPDENGMQELKGPTGPIARDFNKRLRTLEYRARTSAPISKPTSMSRGRAPGSLKSSIRTLHLPQTSEGLNALVGANPVKGGRQKGYALYQHEGTRAHTIRPRNAVALAFFWTRVGQSVVLSSVRHPGNPATKYLTKWLREFVR